MQRNGKLREFGKREKPVLLVSWFYQSSKYALKDFQVGSEKAEWKGIDDELKL